MLLCASCYYLHYYNLLPTPSFVANIRQHKYKKVTFATIVKSVTIHVSFNSPADM